MKLYNPPREHLLIVIHLKKSINNTSSSIEPDSEVKAVWPLDTRANADKATLASYAQSLIARTVLCNSPAKDECFK